MDLWKQFRDLGHPHTSPRHVDSNMNGKSGEPPVPPKRQDTGERPSTATSRNEELTLKPLQIEVENGTTISVEPETFHDSPTSPVASQIEDAPESMPEQARALPEQPRALSEQPRETQRPPEREEPRYTTNLRSLVSSRTLGPQTETPTYVPVTQTIVRDPRFDQWVRNEKSKILKHYEDQVRQVRMEANQRLQGASDQMATLQESKKDAEQACLRYEKEIDQLKAQVKTMQEGSLRRVEAEHWAPLSVSDVTRKLDSLLADIKQWGEKYAKAPIQQVLDPACFERLQTLLYQRDCIAKSGQLQEALKRNKVMQKKEKAAAFLLTAAASSDVFLKIVGDQFFAFTGNIDESDLLRSDVGVRVQDLFEDMCGSNEAGAQAWRCEMFRQLDPHNVGRGTRGEALKKKAQASRQRAAKEHAERLVKDFAKLLIPESQLGSACLSLTEIMLAATELAWSFCTQKPIIEGWGVSRLEELMPARSNRPHLAYTGGGKVMDLHPLHAAELDDNPAALEGKDVLVVCNPAVVAYGNAEGLRYGEDKIWRKALVWLG